MVASRLHCFSEAGCRLLLEADVCSSGSWFVSHEAQSAGWRGRQSKEGLVRGLSTGKGMIKVPKFTPLRESRGRPQSQKSGRNELGIYHLRDCIAWESNQVPGE